MSLMPSNTVTEGTLGREEQLDQWAGHTEWPCKLWCSLDSIEWKRCQELQSSGCEPDDISGSLEWGVMVEEVKSQWIGTALWGQKWQDFLVGGIGWRGRESRRS